jgi:hypothetical protein
MDPERVIVERISLERTFVERMFVERMNSPLERREVRLRGLRGRLPLVAPAFALVLLAGCGEEGREGDEPVVLATWAESPAGVVDSVRPIEEEFRRFTADIPTPPAALEGGAESVEALARRFVEAVAARDTAALRRMHVDRAEFAYFFYRDAPVSRPPYELPPGLLWFQVEGGSSAALTRLSQSLGGRNVAFEGVRCEGEPQPQGDNRIHADCAVTYRVDGERRTGRLFGNVLERAGRFKFLSYANDL